jgi:cob(I)alamin adenosyltransferase
MASSSERPKKSAIYTRTGDYGETSLYNGERKRKDAHDFEALGAVDELSSWIGMIEALSGWPADIDAKPLVPELKSLLQDIQRRLLDIGTHIATPPYSSDRIIVRAKFNPEEIIILEKMIDRMDAALPKLTNFILPRGVFHMCRVVTRRAERLVVPMVCEGHCHDVILRYLNRLSDLFFVLARYCSKDEIVYKKPEDTYYGRGT